MVGLIRIKRGIMARSRPRKSRKTRVSIVNGFKEIPESHTYVIGEAGNNHNGELEKGYKLIDVAIEAGCDAVKFQKRDIDSMLTKDRLDRVFTNVPEWGDTYRKVREHIELSWEEFKKLKEYCKGKIDFIVTPFDIPSVRFLEKLGVDAYKVAAFTLTDIPVLEELAKTNKTIIMSVGMATEQEVKDALEVLEGYDVVLLHCVSSYPMRAEDANLQWIQWLKKFGKPVGFSDHENGITFGPVAVALGARVIEKHYTINRALPGLDHAMSLEPHGLKKLVRNIRKVEKGLQWSKQEREVLPGELKIFDEKRRTIVAAKEIKKGEKITREMLTTKGPNRGLPPKMIPELIGKPAMQDIEADTHITFGMVKL